MEALIKKLMDALETLDAMKYRWGSREESIASVRRICDEQKLTDKERQLIMAVIQAESDFNNAATNKNRDKSGNVLSVDWGICQINSFWHIGIGRTFPSVDYVLQNPHKVVRWMITMMRAGKIGLWCGYVNGSWKKFINNY